MITPGDIEVSDDREQTAACLAMWSAVLRNAVVVKRDLAYLDTEAYRDVCRIMGLNAEWAAKQLRAAAAGGASWKRLPQYRKHTEETRAKISAAVAAFRQRGTAEHEAWRAKLAASQEQRYARLRGERELVS